MTDVRYRPGQPNDILRYALLTVWGWKCYWCTEPIEYRFTEIDHIVPQNSGEEILAKMKQQFGLVEIYDIHASYNLAPICGRCNKGKSNLDLMHVPRIAELARAAEGHVSKVERTVRGLESRKMLAGALMKVAAVDLRDEKTREAFEVGAPAIVQRLASLGADKADFLVSRTVAIKDDDRHYRIELVLNARGRTVITIFEEVAGGDLDTALREPVAELVEVMDSAATDAFEAADAMYGADVEPLTAEFDFIVDRIEFERESPMRLDFTFAGTVSADGSTTIARDSADGDGVEYIQGDASMTGRFKVVLSWGLDEPIGNISVDEVALNGEEIYVSNAREDDRYDGELFDVDPKLNEW